MDYEKKYKEALEKARQIHDADRVSGIELTTCEEIFPELAEFEDGRIRKALIKYLDALDDDEIRYGVSFKDMRTWLEKQGENIDQDNKEYWKGYREGKQEVLDKYVELKKQDKQKLNPKCKSAVEAIKEEKVNTINKVEPKFKDGDWIVCEDTGFVYQIKNCIENLSNHKYGYDLTNGTYISSDEVNHYHLWTIQDAKDGDVLVDVYGNIGIFEQCDDFDWVSYCSLGHNGGFQHFKIEHENEKTYPAAKEQCDTLMKAMNEAGYTFDFEKKELKNAKKKPTWSEEDKNFMYDTLSNLTELKDRYGVEYGNVGKCIDWLKSLRPQNNITDEELAQAKKDAYNDALDKIEYHSGEPTFDDGWSAAIWYLKKKNAMPQTQWKPSDEQLEALKNAIHIKPFKNPSDSILWRLYEQLNKLKS